MGLISKLNLEGLRLDGQFPFTVCGKKAETGIIIVIQEKVVRHQWYPINIVV